MLDWLYNLLGMMLSWFDSITGSYALALLFYALIFKIVFLPFSIKQQKNQIKMAKLAPKIALIKAKYKGRTDQPTLQKQQQEIMELQQKEGYSPLSGCLPLLIQLPLIMLLYTVIQNPLSYIAKNNNVLDNLNSETPITENIPDELLEIYNERKEDGKEITKDDIVLALYKEFYPSTLGNEPTESSYSSTEAYNKAKKEYDDNLAAIKSSDKLPGNTEIKLIGAINDFIHGPNSDLYPNEDARKAYVSSFGLEYSTYPKFDIFGANMATTPSFKNPSIILAIPFITALVQWLSMYLTRKISGNAMAAMQGQDAQTKGSMMIMDLMMPAMTLWMAFSFSAMLGLYWTFQSLLGLLQSFILAKVMPLPKYSEDEIREMNRQQKEAERAGRAAAKAQPKHKSLHYIDEDDYDELPAVETKNDAKKDTKFSSDVPEIKD
jgi:YidC/Oxa1 family membrane protein insertase